ncbi:MAG: hypothetical protein ACHQ0J_05025 [Candidatus Dormibacterales bacterium]
MTSDRAKAKASFDKNMRPWLERTKEERAGRRDQRVLEAAQKRMREQAERLAPKLALLREYNEERLRAIEHRKKVNALAAQVIQALSDLPAVPPGVTDRQLRRLENKARRAPTPTESSPELAETLDAAPQPGMATPPPAPREDRPRPSTWTTSVGGVSYCLHGLTTCDACGSQEVRP